MKLTLNPSCPFNLEVTLCCGQAFRWKKQGEWWYGIVGAMPLKIRQVEDGLEFENADTEFVKAYFGLNDDLPKIFSQICKDEYIKSAIDAFSGLRILRQEPWECLVSYICATYKNISAIKQMLLNLSKKFGAARGFDGYDFYAFPTPEQLACANIDDIRKCGLGYRAEYVLATAKMVHQSAFDFERLKRMSYEEARKELLAFRGVGLKVADCVTLFSLGKLEAFPVDVWIRRAILEHYSRCLPRELVEKVSRRKWLTSSSYERLNLFGREYFGGYAGYAQEYLYHYERVQP
jgi:N-glycosylase/DNA lyase